MIYTNNKNESYNGFIYKWIDEKYNKFYIGSHLGSEDDGYKFGGLDINKEYNNRPNDFYRMILSYHLVSSEYELRNIEGEYLKKFDVENNNNFYNRTNEAYGGHHVLATWKRKNVVGEDGLTSYQRAAIKMVETRKKNNSFVTSKIKEYETKNKDIKNIHEKISLTLIGSRWVNNNVEQKLIKSNEFDKYIEDGWLVGILEKNKNKSSIIKDRIAVNKNGIVKYILKQDIDKYIEDGWIKGGIGYKYLIKNDETIYVKTIEVSKYIDEGWKIFSSKN